MAKSASKGTNKIERQSRNYLNFLQHLGYLHGLSFELCLPVIFLYILINTRTTIK